jgi:hypothetical protein
MSLDSSNDKTDLNSNTNNEELPDFIVYTLKLEKCRCPYGYFLKVRISNIGAEIEDTIVKVKVQLDSEESIILFDYNEGMGISTERITHHEIDPFKKTHIAIVEVDPPYENHPNGDIIESNEDNNILTEIFTKSICESKIAQSEKVLTKEHVKHLLLGLIQTSNSKIKSVIKDIILEITKTGDATITEVKEIAESNGIDSSNVTMLSTVWTYFFSDGSALSIPGFWRSYIYGFMAKGSFVSYSPYFGTDGGWGWDLCIDGEWVSKEGGIIVGYFGYVRQKIDYNYRPAVPSFKLFGFGLLVFHGIT